VLAIPLRGVARAGQARTAGPTARVSSAAGVSTGVHDNSSHFRMKPFHRAKAPCSRQGKIWHAAFMGKTPPAPDPQARHPFPGTGTPCRAVGDSPKGVPHCRRVLRTGEARWYRNRYVKTTPERRRRASSPPNRHAHQAPSGPHLRLLTCRLPDKLEHSRIAQRFPRTRCEPQSLG
jgi:hypothetical protein